jgi:ribosomal protein S6--L-glutamate ligase
VSALTGRRIELWVEVRRGTAAVNPILRALLDGLAADGASISVRVPEHEVIAPGASIPDLVLLKTATSLGLSLALAEEARGIRCLNGARATWAAHDKAAVVARLAAAGLPVPPTLLTAAEVVAVPAGVAGAGPWVTKPVRGVHGHGVAFHDAFPTRIDTTPAVHNYVVDDGTRLVQRRVGGDEADVKVYVADGRCFAGRKRFGPGSFATDDVEPLSLDRQVEDVVHAAGAALGLRCFGADLRWQDGSPELIDVNPFPGYRGFPAAVAALRAEVERSLNGAAR